MNNNMNNNMMNNNNMGFDAGGAVPEFSSTFINNNSNNINNNRNTNNNNNNNNAFGSTKFNIPSTNNTNYSPIISEKEQSNNTINLQWSTMTFSYSKDGAKKNGTIYMPINFK